VLSPQQLPRNGPAILVCNHISGLDPLLVQSICPRVIIWMIAREYYEVKGLNWVFKQVGLIPVERTGRDLASTRASLRALADGKVLGIFPEGRIEPDRQILPFQTGVALMAIKTQVPVFPVWLEGTCRGREITEAVLRPCEASVSFGPAVEFDRSGTDREILEAATQKIEKAVKDLRDKYRAAELR
jgi:1-acyl-sn-glycerol-3-phosphate acyltransferase